MSSENKPRNIGDVLAQILRILSVAVDTQKNLQEIGCYDELVQTFNNAPLLLKDLNDFDKNKWRHIAPESMGYAWRDLQNRINRYYQEPNHPWMVKIGIIFEGKEHSV
jgi:hypothetical protein